MDVNSQLAALRHPWLRTSQLENLVFYSIICCFVHLAPLLFSPLSSPPSFPAVISPHMLLFFSGFCIHLTLPLPSPPAPPIVSLHFLHLSSWLFPFESSSPITSLNLSPSPFSHSPHPLLVSLSPPSPALLSLLSPPPICSPGIGPVKLPVLQSDGDRVQNLITHWLTARTTC